jgi:hypothetical protein
MMVFLASWRGKRACLLTSFTTDSPPPPPPPPASAALPPSLLPGLPGAASLAKGSEPASVLRRCSEHVSSHQGCSWKMSLGEEEVVEEGEGEG